MSDGAGTRRRWLVAAVLVVSVGVGGLAVARAHDRGSATAPLVLRGTWRELPRPPLSPRADTLAVWTGREALFLGGESKPCPPQASCDVAFDPHQAAKYYGWADDGAAYDLRTGTWRHLAPAPFHVDGGSTWAYASGHLFVVDLDGHTWDYDVGQDAWSRFGARWDARNGLSVADGLVFGQTRYDRPRSHVVAYDPVTSAWTRYPSDRLRPRLAGYVVATTGGPVLAGVYASREPYHRRPSTMVVDAWTGSAWRRLPMTPQLEGSPVWTGRRLVTPVQGTRYHGGPDAWPHRYPEGGALDPTTGRWTPLPAVWQDAQVRWNDPAPGWDVETPSRAVGPRFVVRGEVYDDATGSAWLLPRPSGAPEDVASAVWAGGRLVVLGGADFDAQHQTGVSRRAWVYTP